MPAIKLRIGDRFGKLTITGKAQRIQCIGFSELKRECLCDCGNIKYVTAYKLKKGAVQSCGCAAKELTRKRNTTHGKSKTKTYNIWKAMLSRCYRPSAKGYKNYGGRGITVCDRWRYNFNNFLSDMGEVPEEKQLDRRNNNGNYEPENCRWVSAHEQRLNQRRVIIVEYMGHNMPLSYAARKAGLASSTVSGRLRRGWNITRALNTPVQKL